MARTLEFYFDYGSPYSYLADTQVEAIAKRAGAALARKPMLLGGVFKATGNASPMTVALKSKWSAFDMPMWAKHYGVPFKPQSVLPGEHAGADARRGGGADRRHLRALPSGHLQGDVGRRPQPQRHRRSRRRC